MIPAFRIATLKKQLTVLPILPREPRSRPSLIVPERRSVTSMEIIVPLDRFGNPFMSDLSDLGDVILRLLYWQKGAPFRYTQDFYTEMLKYNIPSYPLAQIKRLFPNGSDFMDGQEYGGWRLLLHPADTHRLVQRSGGVDFTDRAKWRGQNLPPAVDLGKQFFKWEAPTQTQYFDDDIIRQSPQLEDATFTINFKVEDETPLHTPPHTEV